MIFPEFNELLKSIFTKEEVTTKPNTDNFNVYLVNRYISMYHPKLCLFINQTMNNYELIQNIIELDDLYKTYKAVVPKVPYRYIEYIKRPSSKTQYKERISEEDIKRYAELMEISTREVRQYLLELDKLESGRA